MTNQNTDTSNKAQAPAEVRGNRAKALIAERNAAIQRGDDSAVFVINRTLRAMPSEEIDAAMDQLLYENYSQGYVDGSNFQLSIHKQEAQQP